MLWLCFRQVTPQIGPGWCSDINFRHGYLCVIISALIALYEPKTPIKSGLSKKTLHSSFKPNFSCHYTVIAIFASVGMPKFAARPPAVIALVSTKR